MQTPTRDPIETFTAWLAEARGTEPNDPNAMSLATVDGHGLPDVRVVLLKGHDARGFVFYTNYEGAKGVQLSVRPYAALGVHWKTLRRQVRVRGPVSRVSAEESDAYFATRPRESQLSAWASEQSRPLDARETFEARLAAANARFPGAVPRPPFWGGFRVGIDAIELWEDRVGRQHHRELFTQHGGGWESTLLYP